MKLSMFRRTALIRWRRAAWIDGDGPFALLAHCRVLTVTLHATRERAEHSKGIIDSTGCGGCCVRKHEIVELTI